MLIVLVGPAYAGKETIANYLVKNKGFSRLCLFNSSTSNAKTNATNVEEYFDSVDKLIDYATIRWMENMVVSDLKREEDISLVLRRPWTLLVGVEAPVLLRWERKRNNMRNGVDHADEDESLLDFVRTDDFDMYGYNRDMLTTNSQHQILTVRKSLSSIHLANTSPSNTIQPVPSPRDMGTPMRPEEPNPTPNTALTQTIRQAHIVISNHYGSIDSLYTKLDEIDIAGKPMTDRLRPTWDEYFMCLAGLASLRSNCMKRRVGAVLVSSTYRVISTGYNGTPRGLTNCNEGGCARCNGAGKMGSSLDECLCLHAEENALLESGRERAGAGNGGILYCNTCPCLRCTVKIVQVGVKEVVYSLSYSMDEKAANIFKEAGVVLRQIQTTSREA